MTRNLVAHAENQDHRKKRVKICWSLIIIIISQKSTYLDNFNNPILSFFWNKKRSLIIKGLFTSWIIACGPLSFIFTYFVLDIFFIANHTVTIKIYVFFFFFCACNQPFGNIYNRNEKLINNVQRSNHGHLSVMQTFFWSLHHLILTAYKREA